MGRTGFNAQNISTSDLLLCSEIRPSRPVIIVHLLGVTISSDLSPVKHVGTISSSCFYWLRQIRRIRRSLDAESAKTRA